LHGWFGDRIDCPLDVPAREVFIGVVVYFGVFRAFMNFARAMT